MTNILKTERLKTDILIIGGGTAGCYAAVTIAEHSDAKVLICEKAHIKRSVFRRITLIMQKRTRTEL